MSWLGYIFGISPKVGAVYVAGTDGAFCRVESVSNGAVTYRFVDAALGSFGGVRTLPVRDFNLIYDQVKS